MANSVEIVRIITNGVVALAIVGCVVYVADKAIEAGYAPDFFKCAATFAPLPLKAA